MTLEQPAGVLHEQNRVRQTSKNPDFRGVPKDRPRRLVPSQPVARVKGDLSLFTTFHAGFMAALPSPRIS